MLRTIGYLSAIFETLTVDDLGKKMVQNTIKNVQISIGTKNTTTLNDQILHLEILSPLSILETKEKELKRRLKIYCSQNTFILFFKKQNHHL